MHLALSCSTLRSVACTLQLTRLLALQDTITDSPAANTTMKRASHLGIAITTLFYMSIGLFGFAAFGNGAPG